LRRLISILLLVVFGFPVVLPMLAMGQDAEASLPACCRRNGKHHCMMSTDSRGKLFTDHSPQFDATPEKCPYSPAAVAPVPPHPLASPAIAAAIYADLISHPAGFSQTEAKRRISLDRSHQKRGPPTFTSL
jgi:hypothetical protein